MILDPFERKTLSWSHDKAVIFNLFFLLDTHSQHGTKSCHTLPNIFKYLPTLSSPHPIFSLLFSINLDCQPFSPAILPTCFPCQVPALFHSHPLQSSLDRTFLKVLSTLVTPLLKIVQDYTFNILFILANKTLYVLIPDYLSSFMAYLLYLYDIYEIICFPKQPVYSFKLHAFVPLLLFLKCALQPMNLTTQFPRLG